MSYFVDANTLNEFAAAWGGTMLSATLRGSLLLAVFALLVQTLRHRSASARHLVWTLGVVALLVMPLLTAALPAWRATVPAVNVPALWNGFADAPAEMKLVTQPDSAKPKTRNYYDTRLTPASYTEPFFEPKAQGAVRSALLTPEDEMAAEPLVPTLTRQFTQTLSGLSAAGWLLLLWEIGLLSVALFFLIGSLRLWWLASNSSRLESPRWNALLDRLVDDLDVRQPVELRMSRAKVTPMTWGIRRSVILLPSDASHWSDDVRHDVLVHELTHVQRRDSLTQTLAQLACAIHWFNPLVWIATAQMRVERERACDDRVLMAGSKASSYASHLLQMARSLKSENCTSFATLAMARRSQLSDRLVAVLDPKMRRGAPSRLRGVALAAMAGLVVLPVAMLTPTWDDLDAAATGKDFAARQAVLPPAPSPSPTPFARSVPAPVAEAVAFRGPADHAVRHEGVHDPGDCVFESGAARAYVVAPTPVEVHPDGHAAQYAWSRDTERNHEVHHEQHHDCETVVAPTARVVTLSDLPRVASPPAVDPAPVVVSSHGYVTPLPDVPAVVAVASQSVGDHIKGLFSFGRGDRSRWIHSDDGYKLVVEVEGDIEFSENEDAIVAMSDDGYFELEEKVGRDRRRVEVESDDGELVFQFFEGRRRVDDDEEAREWLADLLPEVLANMGINIDQRVAKAYASGGVEGLTDKLHQVRSDHLLALHLSEFLALDEASAEDRKLVLNEFLRDIDSDFEVANLLIAAMPTMMSDPQLRDTFVDVLEDIDSDFESRRVLSSAMDEYEFDTPQMVAIVEASHDIDSDFELASFLTSIDDRHLEDSQFRVAYFEAVETLDSDFERSRVLKKVLQHGNTDDETLEFVLRAIHDLDSDFEAAQVLTRTADMFVMRDSHLDEFFDAVENVDSDFERARILKTLLDEHDLPEEAQLRMVAAIDDMDSDFERVNLIVEMAREPNQTEAVREALLEVADDIDSDHEYGRAMKAMRKARRSSGSD